MILELRDHLNILSIFNFKISLLKTTFGQKNKFFIIISSHFNFENCILLEIGIKMFNIQELILTAKLIKKISCRDVSSQISMMHYDYGPHIPCTFIPKLD